MAIFHKMPKMHYKFIKQTNVELKDKGFITIAGKVSRRYFEEKFYGMRGDKCACV